MDITEIPIKTLKEIKLFDIVIFHHGFETYKRDYYFIVESETKENVGRFKILFTHCLDLQYRHKFADKEHPELLRKSLSDDLILPTIPDNLDSYWWGQAFTTANPGFSYDPDSIRAKEMSEISGLPMYTINLETDHYEINLVFHDFRYTFLNLDKNISDQVFIPINDSKLKK
jgi:hypothetical protein